MGSRTYDLSSEKAVINQVIKQLLITETLLESSSS